MTLNAIALNVTIPPTYAPQVVGSTQPAGFTTAKKRLEAGTTHGAEYGTLHGANSCARSPLQLG